MGKLKEGGRERRLEGACFRLKVHKFRKASLAMSSQWPRCRVGGGERVCGSPLLMHASTAAGCVCGFGSEIETKKVSKEFM